VPPSVPQTTRKKKKSSQEKWQLFFSLLRSQSSHGHFPAFVVATVSFLALFFSFSSAEYYPLKEKK
jgi:hypothetical protein